MAMQVFSEDMSMASLDQNEKEKIDLYIPKATDSQPNPWVMYETLEAALAEKDRNAPVAVQLAGAAPEALAAWLAETHQPALKAACQITGDPSDPNSMTGPADKDDGDGSAVYKGIKKILSLALVAGEVDIVRNALACPRMACAGLHSFVGAGMDLLDDAIELQDDSAYVKKHTCHT